MGRNVREYVVFNLSHQLTLSIYEITKLFPSDERFGLISQMRRCAYSIPMNLIEGGARASEAEFKHFVNIARGSSAEVLYQLDLVRDLNYINDSDHKKLQQEYVRVAKMLTILYKTLKGNQQQRKARSE